MSGYAAAVMHCRNLHKGIRSRALIDNCGHWAKTTVQNKFTPRSFNAVEWLPSSIRNEFIAFSGEFVGTFLFLSVSTMLLAIDLSLIRRQVHGILRNTSSKCSPIFCR